MLSRLLFDTGISDSQYQKEFLSALFKYMHLKGMTIEDCYNLLVYLVENKGTLEDILVCSLEIYENEPNLTSTINNVLSNLCMEFECEGFPISFDMDSIYTGQESLNTLWNVFKDVEQDPVKEFCSFWKIYDKGFSDELLFESMAVELDSKKNYTDQLEEVIDDYFFLIYNYCIRTYKIRRG